MRRVLASFMALAGVVAITSCSGGGTRLEDRFGDCRFAPHAVCKHQDLEALGLQSRDLTGADFSGSVMTGTDLRGAILRDAKLVGTNLSGVDLTGADLRGADLSGARLFLAHLENADWTGSHRSGVGYCETFFPDGTVSDCNNPVVKGSSGPTALPAIVTFEPSRPFTCLDDALGQGVEVNWKVRNSTTVAFLVDDVNATTATGTHGIQRVPVECDGALHTFTIQAFGPVPPLAAESFVRSVGR